jgi:hypothetical protein
MSDLHSVFKDKVKELNNLYNKKWQEWFDSIYELPADEQQEVTDRQEVQQAADLQNISDILNNLIEQYQIRVDRYTVDKSKFEDAIPFDTAKNELDTALQTKTQDLISSLPSISKDTKIPSSIIEGVSK